MLKNSRNNEELFLRGGCIKKEVPGELFFGQLNCTRFNICGGSVCICDVSGKATTW